MRLLLVFILNLLNKCLSKTFHRQFIKILINITTYFFLIKLSIFKFFQISVDKLKKMKEKKKKFSNFLFVFVNHFDMLHLYIVEICFITSKFAKTNAFLAVLINAKSALFI